MIWLSVLCGVLVAGGIAVWVRPLRRTPPPVVPVVVAQPTIGELSASLEKAFAGVRKAADRCASASASDGDCDCARDELEHVLRASLGELRGLLRGLPAKSRVSRMARLNAEEVWRVAEPWLRADFTVTHRILLSPDAVPELRGELWRHLDTVVAEAAAPAGRVRLERFVGQLRASSGALGDVAGEPRLQSWVLAVDEVTRAAAATLARPSMGQSAS